MARCLHRAEHRAEQCMHAVLLSMLQSIQLSVLRHAAELACIHHRRWCVKGGETSVPCEWFQKSGCSWSRSSGFVDLPNSVSLLLLRMRAPSLDHCPASCSYSLPVRPSQRHHRTVHPTRPKWSVPCLRPTCLLHLELTHCAAV